MYPRTHPPIGVEEARQLAPDAVMRYVYCIADLGRKPRHGGESHHWINTKWRAFAATLGITKPYEGSWRKACVMHFIGKHPDNADDAFDAWLATNYRSQDTAGEND